jgi:putative phosphoribosyl transferase
VPTPEPLEREVAVQIADAILEGILVRPRDAIGLVVFAHGSGSSRHSPRNRYVASVLNQAKIATLLFDLLTHEEGIVDERTRHLRFDIDLLARRVRGTIDWLGEQRHLAGLALGLFGASTGAAAALVAAAARPERVAVVVSRGGRPDLAGRALLEVRAPTLLLVGEYDREVLDLNETARRQMTQAEVELQVVAGASHLFEEPGALEDAASRAAAFFTSHLARAS